MDSKINDEVRDSALFLESSVLAKDLMDYKLGRSASPVNATAKTLRQLCDEIEDKNPMLMEKICEALLVSNTVYQSFSRTAKGIFCDGVNWGRIVILFAFGAKLAKYCHKNGMVEELDNIPYWIGQTVAEYGNWIERNGGLKNLNGFRNQEVVDWKKTMFIATIFGAGAVIFMNVFK